MKNDNLKNINYLILEKIDNLLDKIYDETEVSDTNFSEKNKFSFVDIVTFIESDQYLGQKLYPWQMLILKIFYMGTVGNENLKINFNHVDEICNNCVWNNNKLNMFKSPCLCCLKFNKDKKNKYFEQEIDVGRISNSEYLEWNENIKINNNFVSEIQMIFNDLTPDNKKIDKNDIYQRASDISNYYNGLTFNELSDLLEDKDYEEFDSDISDKKDTEFEKTRDQIIRKIGKPFTDLVLVLGRRSGKSLLTSIIALYEAYRLIKMNDPQNYFGLLEDDLITILNVAGSEDQSKDSVFTKIKSLAVNSPFFKKYINTNRTGEQSIILFAPKDIEKNKIRKEEGLPTLPGSIEIKSGTSNASSQVGKTTAVIIIDEVAEMIKKEDSKMSDSELYSKLKPSLATFGKFGKICVISNPLAEEGILWKLYNNALRNSANPLMFQLPSKLCNPSLEKEWLEEQRKEDADMFEMQYMAKFSKGTTEPLIPSVLIDLSINPRRKRALYGIPGVHYYAHADPAFNSDNYALAICHAEDKLLPNTNEIEKCIIVDHVEMWRPRSSKEKVVIEEVDNYILDICKRKFNVVSLSYDQWCSISSIQKMQKNGIKAIETRFSASYIEKIYETLIHLMQDERVEIYGSGQWVPEIKDQLLFLQKKYNRRGFRVQAAEGHFDDIPDCIAGAAYMALQKSVFASLPKIRSSRLGIDAAERFYSSANAKRIGKDGY
jgi:hypothetical protein